jgi:hypothetical protein
MEIAMGSVRVRVRVGLPRAHRGVVVSAGVVPARVVGVGLSECHSSVLPPLSLCGPEFHSSQSSRDRPTDPALNIHPARVTSCNSCVRLKAPRLLRADAASTGSRTGCRRPPTPPTTVCAARESHSETESETVSERSWCTPAEPPPTLSLSRPPPRWRRVLARTTKP